MPKYKVLALAKSVETRSALHRKLSQDADLALVGFADKDAGLMTKITGYAPHVVLLVQEEGDAGLLETASRIYQGFPGCALVLLASQPDLNLIEEAMRSGIRQVVGVADMDRLRDALIQAAVFELGRTGDVEREPRVIAVYGGKGGVGRTTIAVNLSAALARSGRRTALLDLCLTFGDAALLLNLKTKDTIAELVQVNTAFSIEDIKSFSVPHASGLSLLCAPSSPEYAEYVTPRHIETIINLMRPYFDFIVIDLPPDLSECTLTAAENANDILLVNHPELSSLRAAKLTINILRTLQQEDKVQLILNRDRKGILSHSDFEQVLDKPLAFIIPEDEKTARLSQERGVPAVMGMPRSRLSQGVLRIEKHFAQRKQEKRK